MEFLRLIVRAIVMLFLDSIGWSPASDVIVVYTYAADCVLNLVYAQPLQKTVAKLRVSLTLNSSDIAVICASTDVN